MHGVTRLKVTEDVSLIHFSSIPDDMKVIADIFSRYSKSAQCRGSCRHEVRRRR